MKDYSKYFKKITVEEFENETKEIKETYLEVEFNQMNRLKEYSVRYSQTVKNSMLSQNIIEEISKYLQNLSKEKSDNVIQFSYLVWKEDSLRLIEKSYEFEKGTALQFPWSNPRDAFSGNVIEIMNIVSRQESKYYFYYSKYDDIFWLSNNKERFRCDDTLGLIKLIEWDLQK